MVGRAIAIVNKASVISSNNSTRDCRLDGAPLHAPVAEAAKARQRRRHGVRVGTGDVLLGAQTVLGVDLRPNRLAWSATVMQSAVGVFGSARQRFFLPGLAGASRPVVGRFDAAAAAGLVAFGFLASRLLRFCPLAMTDSFCARSGAPHASLSSNDAASMGRCP